MARLVAECKSALCLPPQTSSQTLSRIWTFAHTPQTAAQWAKAVAVLLIRFIRRTVQHIADMGKEPRTVTRVGYEVPNDPQYNCHLLGDVNCIRFIPSRKQMYDEPNVGCTPNYKNQASFQPDVDKLRTIPWILLGKGNWSNQAFEKNTKVLPDLLKSFKRIPPKTGR
ncbi:hypothetical protein CLF_106649 [Clonorchis sinensis]|uniref:Uncharacterized protein n=1 Tax=Clonorchis sinensis TaxID=79923 RepID=G7YQ44_CLOSI|nr:hypothetical protein CLF_106649 [Clonorchis sinensis]